MCLFPCSSLSLLSGSPSFGFRLSFSKRVGVSRSLPPAPSFEHRSMGQTYHPPTLGTAQHCEVHALVPSLAPSPPHVCHLGSLHKLARADTDSSLATRRLGKTSCLAGSLTLDPNWPMIPSHTPLAKACAVKSARYDPTNIRPVFLCFQLGSHQDLPHSHSSLTFLKFSNNTHSRGILCTTRSSSLQFNHALRYHFVDVAMIFLCRPYVTGYSGHLTRTHKTVMILSLFTWIVSDKKVRKMMITKDSLNETPFFVTQHTNDIS